MWDPYMGLYAGLYGGNFFMMEIYGGFRPRAARQKFSYGAGVLYEDLQRFQKGMEMSIFHCNRRQ